jgi:hypothetical protein
VVGGKDWQQLKEMKHIDIANLVRDGFQRELDYRFAAAYPIYDRESGKQSYVLHDSRLGS